MRSEDDIDPSRAPDTGPADRHDIPAESRRLKDGFAANLAHELRTPLSGLIGFAELLYSGRPGPVNERQRECLGNILGSAQHMLRLIDEVLDLARLEAGRLMFQVEPVALAAIVSEMCAAMGPAAAEKRITLNAEVSASLGIVMLDATRMRQVLLNYLSNAIKFTPPGGRVTVRMHGEGDRAIRIEVDDTGVGIAEEDLPRMFEDFGQLEAGGAKDEGVGLGLALTRRIVEAQGGSVGVRSTAGIGTVFWAIIPAQRGGSSGR